MAGQRLFDCPKEFTRVVATMPNFENDLIEVDREFMFKMIDNPKIGGIQGIPVYFVRCGDMVKVWPLLDPAAPGISLEFRTDAAA